MQQTNKRYTIGEEIFNSVTHGVGVLIAIAFMVLLIIKSQGNTPLIIANIIYGVSLMLMFLSSTLYHAITNTKAKQVLRYFDHSAIFICIAGTFTPIIVRVLQGAQRVGFLVAVWLIAIIGIILKITIFRKNLQEKYKKQSLILYVVMGWMSVLLMKKVIQISGMLSFILILSGGILYSIGVYFYAKKRKYFHSIWHIFIILASVAQFFGIYFG
ncbi:MAG: hemolysin III family protein [Finegoldia magna]|uniref:PAQR family membrane homeostasis protein TrhA n=1 Tax=Finegoldia magna TaxID=1260 RepID=UPI000B91CE17|nr:hemolysin III family protein [Finegoldia magna]MDU4018251.1 hemolysin III family protein [Finegoldia magna]MDU5369391.1 hemolysin III family protein [Finegoldia magna]MDU5443153.1 hemolysin III family protein [Finegoldia magna]MDU5977958.1 hemolysin III family protein [Finegoldia magna]OXZ26173.1 hemolysin III [Finegoldia magna]